MSVRSEIRPGAAVFTALCGMATAAGGTLTWLTAAGARPRLGMDHTSLRLMLVYTYSGAVPFWKSVGLAVLVLGVLMIIGAITGVRTLTIVAALLALAAAGMWIGLVAHHFSTPNLPNSHYLNPANLPWAGLRSGAWLTIAGTVLGLVGSFFSRRAR